MNCFIRIAALRNAALLLSVVVGTFAQPGQARGQSAQSDRADQLQEVVVTAQRVATDEQRTPISVETYSREDLVREDIHDLASLAAADPSLEFNRNGGHATLTLRGISTNNTTAIGSPSVPVAVDDFVINRSVSLDTTLFDLAQVEVLRGPQGTLFGRAASAGLVQVTTQRPTHDLEFSGDVEYGNYQMINLDGMLNIPVSDALQVRAAVMARRHNGYRINSLPEAGADTANPDDEDAKAARVEVAWKPFEHFDGLFIYQGLNQNSAGPAIQAVEFNYDNVALGANSDISHQKPNLGNAFSFPMYGPGQYYHHQDNFGKMHLNYELPFGATVSYLGGYDEYRHNELPSADPPWPVQLYPALGQYYPTPFHFTEHPRTQNHELRIASQESGRFQYQAGLYYFRETNNTYAESLANPGSITAEFVPGFGNAFLYAIATRSKAAYGQVSYEIMPGNTISLGGRYSEDYIHRNGYFIAPSVYPPLPPPADWYYQDDRTSSNKATYHVGYDWTPTDKNLVYGKVDSGYKPGGFSDCGSNTIPYLPESVTNFEIGNKNRFNDDRLQFNITAFYENYSDEQIATYSRGCSTGLVTTNAGKSRIYGAESELIALVDPIGRFNLALSYLNAKFIQFYATPEIGSPALADCNVHNFYDSSDNLVAQQCDLKGHALPQAPTITIAVGFEHSWTLPEESSFKIRTEARYVSKQYLTVFSFPDETQGGFATANLFLTYARPSWDLSLFARNITNKVYLTFAQENGGGSDYLYAYGPPRVFGVRLSAKFNGGQK